LPELITLASCSTVISVFAIVILSAIAGLYRNGHEEFVGGIEDPPPEEGNAVAGTIFTAVIVYAVRLSFCITPRPPPWAASITNNVANGVLP
jgi:hypothetical protein